MNGDAPLLDIKGLRRYYRQPDGSFIRALTLDSLEAREGEMIAVTGPSGSGKTTLLHILAALIRPSVGDVVFGGRNLRSLGESADDWRARSVGYVFQDMNLLPDFNIFENLMIASEISHVPKREAQERAPALLRRLGLEGRKYSRPANLSLGEQQRAAIARAALHSPPLILADEPTASLDAGNARTALEPLLELCAESRSLLIVATHDENSLKLFSRVVRLNESGAGHQDDDALEESE